MSLTTKQKLTRRAAIFIWSIWAIVVVITPPGKRDALPIPAPELVVVTRCLNFRNTLKSYKFCWLHLVHEFFYLPIWKWYQWPALNEISRLGDKLCLPIGGKWRHLPTRSESKGYIAPTHRNTALRATRIVWSQCLGSALCRKHKITQAATILILQCLNYI